VIVGAVARARLVGLFEVVGPVTAVAGWAGGLAGGAAEQPTSTLMAAMSSFVRDALNIVILMLVS